MSIDPHWDCPCEAYLFHLSRLRAEVHPIIVSVYETACAICSTTSSVFIPLFSVPHFFQIPSLPIALFFSIICSLPLCNFPRTPCRSPLLGVSLGCYGAVGGLEGVVEGNSLGGFTVPTGSQSCSGGPMQSWSCDPFLGDPGILDQACRAEGRSA